MGLAAAHDQQVLDRDLKPSNIMVDHRGNVRITDFGVAQLADVDPGEEGIPGTPAYMSPERLERAEATFQSDIYSLGLILFEIFTGKQAYSVSSVPGLGDAVKQGSTTTPSTIVENFDPDVERLIVRCLEPDPRNRPNTAAELVATLPGANSLSAILLLTRYGLLTIVVSWYVTTVMAVYIFTSDMSLWFAGSSLVVLAGIIATGAYCCYWGIVGRHRQLALGDAYE